ncbi:unnamed protein product [Linum trigynum]|uniref:Uncharacterized protein n=1 Tax=Linum trigynum TaxID=586398 RepID=A0AAV2F356_9ROSI
MKRARLHLKRLEDLEVDDLAIDKERVVLSLGLEIIPLMGPSCPIMAAIGILVRVQVMGHNSQVMGHNSLEMAPLVLKLGAALG